MDYDARAAGDEDFAAFKGRPVVIRFSAPSITSRTGKGPTQHSLNVHMPDGDVAGVLNKVREQGYIASVQPDGSLLILPWPCAVVEVFAEG